MLPPFRFENDLFFGICLLSEADLVIEQIGIVDNCEPDIMLVISEVKFISVGAFEVDIEPLCELGGQHNHIIEPVQVEGSVNYDSHFIVC